jgi:hypothetical protein
MCHCVSVCERACDRANGCLGWVAELVGDGWSSEAFYFGLVSTAVFRPVLLLDDFLKFSSGEYYVLASILEDHRKYSVV